MITSNHCVPYLPEDAKLPVLQLLVDTTLDSQVTGWTLVYLTKSVIPWYGRTIETILLLREVLEIDDKLPYALRRKLYDSRHRTLGGEVRREDVLDHLRGKASVTILTEMLRRFDWLTVPANINHEDFAVDEFWFTVLVDVHIKFFKGGEDDRRRMGGDDLYGRWLTGATLLTNSDRAEFIWRSMAATASAPNTAELNIFKSVTADPLDENNYVDDLNRNYDGPPAAELDRMAAEDETYAINATAPTPPSPALQKLTVHIQSGNKEMIQIPETDFPITLESLYLKIRRLEHTVDEQALALITQSSVVTVYNKRYAKLQRALSWLLAVWILTAVLFAALLAINLKNFI